MITSPNQMTMRYLSRDLFPAQRDELISAAIAAGAPDQVLELLGEVDAQETFTYRYLSQALALGAKQRLASEVSG